MEGNYFVALNDLNVNNNVEKKKAGNAVLSYLSWPYAWAEVKKRYPDAQYKIWKDERGLPYVADPETGIMVYTSVTIANVTHEMWLPVMDGANKAMKLASYTYSTRNGDRTVEAATMFDINKAIMRCLVKNLAMHGVGLYIYAGEDLPEAEKPEPVPAPGEYAPPDEDAPIICEVCGARLPDYSDGQRLFKAAELGEQSQNRYRKVLCANCQNRAVNEQKQKGTVICMDCLSQIMDGKRKDGTVWPATDIITYAQKMYQRPLCQSCLVKRKKMAK